MHFILKVIYIIHQSNNLKTKLKTRAWTDSKNEIPLFKIVELQIKVTC